MFNVDVLIRGAIALAIILGSLGIYLLYNWTLQFRTRNLLTDLGPKHPGAFTLVYFTTPTCIPCKTVQRPAIQRLHQMLGNALHVVEIDATERPDLAKIWGVMSVPTTFLLNAKGEARYVNNGVARAEKLMEQIQTL